MTLLKTVTRLSVDKGAAKSGIDICYGTTRIWRYRFGLTPAPGVNRTRVQTMRAFTHSPWHLVVARTMTPPALDELNDTGINETLEPKKLHQEADGQGKRKR